MRVFLNTECTGLHQDTILISLGLVDETGQSFYAAVVDSRDKMCSRFDPTECYGNAAWVAECLAKWLSKYKKVQVWADCSTYDWMLFCKLWGHEFSIPKNIYYAPYDLSTLLKIKDVDPDVNREAFAGMEIGAEKHNPMWNAKVCKACYEKAISL